MIELNHGFKFIISKFKALFKLRTKLKVLISWIFQVNLEINTFISLFTNLYSQTTCGSNHYSKNSYRRSFQSFGRNSFN